jgi:protein TonB
MDNHKPDFDDIVFQNRNKAYGAYQLRRRYQANLLKGFLLAMVLLLLLIYFEDITNLFDEPYERETVKNAVVELTPLDKVSPVPLPPPPTVPEKPKPVKKDPPKSPAKKLQKVDGATAPIPTKDDKIVEPKQDSLGSTGGNQSDSIKEGSDEPPIPQPPAPPPRGPIVKLAEQMPMFPGGNTAMISFIFQNMRYPVQARDKGIEGKVYITFIVEKDGTITHVEIKQDIGMGCGSEAARVVRAMPKWSPGRTEGKDVRVQMTLPIEFKLIDIPQ